MTEYDDHIHKFFVFQVKTDFQVYTPPLAVFSAVAGDKELALKPDPDVEAWFGKQLYEKVEYAILGCNCGEVIRTRVKEQ